MKQIIQQELIAHQQTAQAMDALTDAIEVAAKLCIDALKNGKKILIFGNGGSAADAQHIAAELVGRYKTERKGLPAIALLLTPQHSLQLAMTMVMAEYLTVK